MDTCSKVMVTGFFIILSVALVSILYELFKPYEPWT
jgi:hypothetical protein